MGGWLVLERFLTEAGTRTLPQAPAIDIRPLFPSPAPVRTTITANWMKVPVLVFPSMLVSDRQLWRRMNFDDWDTLPPGLRDEGLRAIIAAYGHLLWAPREWDRMSADDWDLVPQPMRALAFMNMMRYWSGYYQVGARYALARGTMTNTLNAILMVESWFEHRAVSTSRSGNRDLGLGQASDYARATMQQLFRRGLIEFAPQSDAEYFNPWLATRMTAIWVTLMLDEQHGDLEAAIRAYHAGSPQTSSPAAEEYLSNVLQKRRRFMRDRIGSPSWEALMRLGEAPAATGPAARAHAVGTRPHPD
jgi:hypothetical protein